MEFPHRYITSTYVPLRTWHTIMRSDERQFATTYNSSLHVCHVALHHTRELRAHYLVHQLDSKPKLVSTIQITLLLMSCIGAW
jgi:hypothetical protein